MRQPIQFYLDKTKTYLDGISPKLINELTKVVNGEWRLENPEDKHKVHVLDFEVFTDSYSIVLYPMDDTNTQLGHKSLLSEYSDGVLFDEALNPDLNEYDEDNDDDEKELEEFSWGQQEIFIGWFVDCWNKTETRKLTIPIYLSTHDSDESYDLRAGKWISNDEKWA